jgi:uncharacterized damage-inducible protein DinB
MSEQIEQLNAQFRSLNDDVINAVEECTDEQWHSETAAENWTVAALAHHIATVNSGFAGMVERLAAGDTYTPNISMDKIHEENAKHAREYASVGKTVVLDELRSGGSAVVAALEKLNDEDLDRHAGLFGGNPLTVGQVFEYVVIGHTAEHCGSMKATLDK